MRGFQGWVFIVFFGLGGNAWAEPGRDCEPKPGLSELTLRIARETAFGVVPEEAFWISRPLVGEGPRTPREPAPPSEGLTFESVDLDALTEVLIRMEPWKPVFLQAMGGKVNENTYVGEAKFGEAGGVQGVAGGRMEYYSTDSIPKWLSLKHRIIVPLRKKGRVTYSATGAHLLDQELAGRMPEKLVFRAQQQAFTGGIALDVEGLRRPLPASGVTLRLEAGPGFMIEPSGAQRVVPAVTGMASLEWKLDGKR